MKALKEKLQDKKSMIVICFIILFTIMMPYLQKGLIIGDDYEYHLSRIESIKDSLEVGIFPVKIHPQLANTYGYGSGLFYPNLFLYIPAIIGLFGADLVLSYKIFIGIMLCFMFFITYYSLKNITEDKNSALIGTIIIMLSKNVCLNLMFRFALGEFLGFIFIVPVISGMYDYVNKDFKKPYLLFIGFFGLINSHLITTLICLIFCIIYFLINIKSTIKNWKKFIKLLIVALLVVFTSAYFWMPMLEQISVQTYNISRPWTNIGSEEYSLYDLFGAERYSIGMLITLFLPLIFYGILDKNISEKSKILCVFFVVIAILTTNFAIWKLTNEYSNIIQFKWRLVGILTIIAGISISLLLKEYSIKMKFKLEGILIGILIVSMYFNIQYNKVDYFANERKWSLESLEDIVYARHNSLGGGKEYLPIEVNYDKLVNPYQAISDSGEKIYVAKNNLHLQFEKEDSEQLSYEVPYIYYYGYVANLTDEDGNVIPLKVEKSENGLVKVITNDESGTVSVWYNGTRIQKISYIISIIFAILSIVYFCLIEKCPFAVKEKTMRN